MKQDKWKDYWHKNLRLIAILLAIWFLISYGAAAISPMLNNITIPVLGFPLGFWFASQGSLIGFVLIILAYARMMNKMDDDYGVSDVTAKLTKTEEKVKIRAN